MQTSAPAHSGSLLDDPHFTVEEVPSLFDHLDLASVLRDRGRYSLYPVNQLTMREDTTGVATGRRSAGGNSPYVVVHSSTTLERMKDGDRRMLLQQKRCVWQVLAYEYHCEDGRSLPDLSPSPTRKFISQKAAEPNWCGVMRSGPMCCAT